MTTPKGPATRASEEYAPGPPLLPSWNDGPTKQSIVNFVRGVTTAGDSHFVEPKYRIAVVDNDGTLCSEQPMPFQFDFVIGRLKEMAPQHPEWKVKQPMAAVLAGDMKTVAARGARAVLELAKISAEETG